MVDLQANSSSARHDKDDGPTEGVGYAAQVHYFLPLIFYLKLQWLPSCLGRDDFVIVITTDFENVFDYERT